MASKMAPCVVPVRELIFNPAPKKGNELKKQAVCADLHGSSKAGSCFSVHLRNLGSRVQKSEGRTSRGGVCFKRGGGGWRRQQTHYKNRQHQL